MKTLVRMTGFLALIVWGAAAQDDVGVARMKAKLDAEMGQQIQMKMVGAVAGRAVKGAPYSGEEVNETNQVLADGTRIHREIHTKVYRDSEGRTRRETPDNITITDPVAGATWVLNPKTMTGSKLAMAGPNFSYFRTDNFESIHRSGNDMPTTFSMHMTSDGGTPTMTVNGQTIDTKTVEELIAKAKASGDHTVTIAGNTIDAGMLTGETKPRAMAAAKMVAILPKGDPIGKQMIEGVEADGTRNVETIEAGAIGNDRPIQVTNERWYSSDLQMVIQSKHSDPRTGEETFRLINIQRGDPSSYLFQPPSGYTINERK
jgi:hypothetical protein